MQAKQLEASACQEPGVAVTDLSCPRTPGATRDRASDPQGPGPEAHSSVHEQADEGGRNARFRARDHGAGTDRG
jgi:hypothetical protein